MPNIKFSYFYRDSGNYKKFGSVIFSNSGGIGLAELEGLIRSKLISGEFFYAAEWGLPECFTECTDFRMDPAWHEFEELEYTDEAPNGPCSLPRFIWRLKPTRK